MRSLVLSGSSLVLAFVNVLGLAAADLNLGSTAPQSPTDRMRLQLRRIEPVGGAEDRAHEVIDRLVEKGEWDALRALIKDRERGFDYAAGRYAVFHGCEEVFRLADQYYSRDGRYCYASWADVCDAVRLACPKMALAYLRNEARSPSANHRGRCYQYCSRRFLSDPVILKAAETDLDSAADVSMVLLAEGDSEPLCVLAKFCIHPLEEK